MLGGYAMNRWQEQFENHTIHKNLQKIKAILDKAPKDFENDQLVEVRRIKKIISYYDQVLKDLDPEITSFKQLDGLSDFINQNIFPSLNDYQNSKNVQNLIDVNNQLTGQLNQLGVLHGIAGKIDINPAPSDLEQQLDDIARVRTH